MMAVHATLLHDHILLAISLAITLAILCLLDFALVGADHGFSVEVIHRVSPNAAGSAAVPVITVTGAGFVSYLIQISIGTPPQKIRALLDTGSALSWTQCQGCTVCNPITDPAFDPKKSSTYKLVPSQSSQCKLLSGGSVQQQLLSSQDDDKICHFSQRYDEGEDYVNGDLALDTITFESSNSRISPVTLPGTIFGCGFDNHANLNDNSSGRIGIGVGKLSLISQMGSLADGKFSYCLPAWTSKPGTSSKMNFGSEAVVSGPGVVSTPLYPEDPDDIFPQCYVTLEAMSVNGGVRIKYDGYGDSSRGNIAIDTAKSWSILPVEFYEVLVGNVSQAIPLKPIKQNEQPISKVVQMWYGALCKHLLGLARMRCDLLLLIQKVCQFWATSSR